MSDPHAHAIDRLRQHQTARRQQHTPPAAATMPPPTHLPAGFQLGDRVYDTISGEEGEVVHGTAQNVVSAAPKR